MSEPDARPDWARIADEAAAAGFGTPDSSASQEPGESAGQPEQPTRIPLVPGGRRRGRPPKNDTAGAKTPPPKQDKAKSPLPPYREGMFVQPLEELYTYIGMAVMVVDSTCAQGIIMSAHECAVSLDKMAKTNHAVRRTLVLITQSTAFGAVIMAHMPILAIILLHHVPAARRILGQFGEQLIQGFMAAAAQRNAEPDEQNDRAA